MNPVRPEIDSEQADRIRLMEQGNRVAVKDSDMVASVQKTWSS